MVVVNNCETSTFWRTMEAFLASINDCVMEIRFLEKKNNQDHTFEAKFWRHNSDFSLARDVLIAASYT